MSNFVFFCPEIFRICHEELWGKSQARPDMRIAGETRKADRFPDPPQHNRLVSRGCASKRSDRFLKLTDADIGQMA
ncbi:MAG: hypothetical protein CMP81_23845 [Fulvimarina sp.]|nr:hypothetical protein [Fulvimarina sp.]